MAYRRTRRAGSSKAVPKRWLAVPKRWLAVPKRWLAVPKRWLAVPKRWRGVAWRGVRGAGLPEGRLGACALEEAQAEGRLGASALERPRRGEGLGASALEEALAEAREGPVCQPAGTQVGGGGPVREPEVQI